MYMYDQPDEVPTLLDMDSQNLCTPSNSMSSLTMPVVKSEPLDMPAMMPPQAIKREPHDMMGMSQLEYIKTEPQHMMDYNHMGVMNMNSHMYPMTNYPHPMMHSLPPLPPQPHQIQQQQQQQQQQHQHNTALTQPERKPGKKSKIKQEKITDNFKEKKPRRKVDRFHGTPEEEVAKRTLPDILMPNLDIVIIGINPGLMAAYKGHHYAGPGNHFWKCLYLSGLVDEPMTCMDDHRLLQFNIGFTNIVSRTTRGSSDLTRKEIKDGARILTDKMRKYRPLIACFNGKGIYEIFSGKKDFEIGRQPETMPDTDTVIYVMPSSSARCSQFPRATDKVNFYTTLKELRDELKQMKRKTAPPLPALPPPPQSTTQQPQDQQQQQQQQQQQPTQLQQPAQQPSAQQQQKEQQQQQQQPAGKVKQEGGQPANCPGQQQGQTTPVRVKMENQNDCVTSCTSSGSTAYHGTVQGPVPHQSLPALPPHAGPMLIKQEPGSFYPNTCGGQYPQPPPPLPSGRQEPGMGYPVIKQEMPDPQMRHYGAGGLPVTTAHNQFQPGYFMDQIPTIGMGENGAMPMRNHLPPQQQQQQQAQQQQMVNNHATGNGPMAMPPAPIDPAMPNYGHSYPDPRGASPHPYPQQMYPQQHLQQQQQQQQHPPPQYPQQMSQQPEPNQKQQHSGPSAT